MLRNIIKFSNVIQFNKSITVYVKFSICLFYPTNSCVIQFTLIYIYESKILVKLINNKLLLTVKALWNSLKSTDRLPSLSKCFSNTWHWSVFKFTPIYRRPFSISSMSSDLLLLASRILNTYLRPLNESELLFARVSLMSLTRVGPSYERASGCSTGFAASASCAVKIYQQLLACGFFYAKSITFLPTISPDNCWPLCISTILLALTSYSFPN